MYHNTKLTAVEKLKACLDLSDFIFKVMRSSLSKSEFEKRLRSLRKTHQTEDLMLLENLARSKG